MKIVKYLAFALGGIVALVAAVIVVVVVTFDPNHLKDELVQVVKDKKQRTLKIEGDVGLSFWPSVGAKLNKVSLSERGSGEEFAAFDTARVSVRVLPLLSRRVVIDAVELDGARAIMVRHKDGTTNIDDLLSKESDDNRALRFDIGKIRAARSQLAYRDERSGEGVMLSDLALTTGRIGNTASGKLDVATRVSAEKPDIAAQLKLSGTYRFDLDKKTFGLSELDARMNGTVAGIKDVDLKVAVAQMQAESGRTLAVDSLALAFTGKRGGETLDLVLNAPKLALSPDKASGDAIEVSAKTSGVVRTVGARLSLSGAEGSLQSLKIAKLAFDLDAKAGNTSLKARLASPVTVSINLLTLDLPAYVGEFAVDDPRIPMKSVKLPVSGRARADFAKRSASVDLQALLDESRVAARVTVPRFSPLAFGFDVDVDRLNADKYLPARAPAGAGGAGGGGGSGRDSPIDFSALKGINASGIVRVGALQLANVKATNVRMEIKAANGRVDVAPHSASLYNGSLMGALTLNANNNGVALKQNLTGVSINGLVRDVLRKDVVEGRGNVFVDVSGAGNSAAAIKKSLAGSARVDLRDGAIRGINLAQALRNAKALAPTNGDMERKASPAEKTDFSELSASFRIARGIARNDDLVLKSPFLRVGGAGDVNLAEDRLNYVARAAVVTTSAGQGGKDLEYLKGVTVPVRIAGPFDNLSYRVELASLVTQGANARVEQKKQEVRAKAQEKIQESLNGLFKK